MIILVSVYHVFLGAFFPYLNHIYVHDKWREDRCTTNSFNDKCHISNRVKAKSIAVQEESSASVKKMGLYGMGLLFGSPVYVRCVYPLLISNFSMTDVCVPLVSEPIFILYHTWMQRQISHIHNSETKWWQNLFYDIFLHYFILPASAPDSFHKFDPWNHYTPGPEWDHFRYKVICKDKKCAFDKIGLV